MGRSPAIIARITAELVIAAIGLTLVVGALAATQGWLDHHFLPSFLFPRDWYVRAETAARVCMAIAGLWLIVSTRPRVGRLVARAPGMTFSVVIAVLLAFAASEVALRGMRLRPTEWLVPDEEPRRQPDAKLGWTLVPGRVGQNSIAGRVIEYAIDPNGYRVASLDAPVDHAKPTVVFIGESVVFGEGLTWEESIPAQVAALTGMQTANLAVHGFGNDQAFMRLQIELPRFQQPVAVVSLFMPALFGRNLDHDRPHLGPGLVWQAPEPRSRLASLASMLVPYRSDDTIAHGVESTREVLRGTIALAQSRGAQAIVVVPQFGPDSEPERLLRQRVLDEGQVPYVLVPIDAEWRLAWDRHPDARAAHAMALAISTALSTPLRQSRPQSR
jgi:hypothetical protein